MRGSPRKASPTPSTLESVRDRPWRAGIRDEVRCQRESWSNREQRFRPCPNAAQYLVHPASPPPGDPRPPTLIPGYAPPALFCRRHALWAQRWKGRRIVFVGP